jgi:hypothetical protein
MLTYVQRKLQLESPILLTQGPRMKQAAVPTYIGVHFISIFPTQAFFFFLRGYNSMYGLYSPGARVASAQWHIGDALTTGGTTTD